MRPSYKKVVLDAVRIENNQPLNYLRIVLQRLVIVVSCCLSRAGSFECQAFLIHMTFWGAAVGF